MKATQQARKPIATGLAAFRSRDDAQASRDAVGSRLQQTCAAAAAALYHDDATNIRAPWGEPVRGRQAMLDALTAILRAFPDGHSQIDRIPFLGELEGVLRETQRDGGE